VTKIRTMQVSSYMRNRFSLEKTIVATLNVVKIVLNRVKTTGDPKP
jgi:hypothetical protein